MKFTVVWIPAAEAQLATIWASAFDRAAVTAAANTIDEKLRRDPILRSEAISQTLRVLIEEPLLARFVVEEDDRIVRVLAIERAPADPSRN